MDPDPEGCDLDATPRGISMGSPGVCQRTAAAFDATLRNQTTEERR
jgi:hypothetical protein